MLKHTILEDHVVIHIIQRNGKQHESNVLGIRGVSKCSDRDKYVATCMVDGKRDFLGRFDTVELANAAVITYRQQHMPFSTT